MQGQAFLVTFCAIAKSGWPRAAMEREGGGRETSLNMPCDGLRVNGGEGRIHFIPPPPPKPTPALRERGEARHPMY